MNKNAQGSRNNRHSPFEKDEAASEIGDQGDTESNKEQPGNEFGRGAHKKTKQFDYHATRSATQPNADEARYACKQGHGALWWTQPRCCAHRGSLYGLDKGNLTCGFEDAEGEDNKVGMIITAGKC